MSTLNVGDVEEDVDGKASEANVNAEADADDAYFAGWHFVRSG